MTEPRRLNGEVSMPEALTTQRRQISVFIRYISDGRIASVGPLAMITSLA
jgi:hypothetical protein